jgi:iron complex outermembrane receptor protein
MALTTPCAPVACALTAWLSACGLAAAQSGAAGPANEPAQGSDEVSDEEPDSEPSTDLDELSLEELMGVDVVVTSVSRSEQSLSRTAAAVYVITAEEIERSGATSIPELLRLAPGVDVARLDSNRWAVSIRGFNDQFANKLLVLIDGRSVYTPLFSGTFWDVQDVPLRDIERIEVIRGPGGPLWGANAVNGIVNIITKHSSQTAGAKGSLTVGDYDRTIGFLRWGESAENSSWRVWTKYLDRASSQAPGGGDGGDEWELPRIGFRTDRKLSERDELTLQGDFFDGHVHNTFANVAAPPPQYAFSGEGRTDVAGGSLQSGWTRAYAEGDEFRLGAYLDYTSREVFLFDEQRTNLGLELQRRMPFGAHDVTVGAALRVTHADSDDRFVLSLNSPERTISRASLFFQDQITLTPERWALILGARLEHEDVVGAYAQPSVRLLYTPDERQTWWCALSRAVRTPSQIEQDMTFVAAVIPGPPDQYVTYFGERDLEPETMDAVELGYRVRPSDRLSIDAALYCKRYSDLVQFLPGTPFMSGPDVVIPFFGANVAEADSYGFELSTEWLARDDTRVSLAWSVQQLDIESGAGPLPADDAAEGQSPSSQVRLRVQHDFDAHWRTDLFLWRVERLETGDIPAYWRFDANLSRRISDRGSLSVGVQNLLHDDEREFQPTTFGASNEVVTSVYARLDWSF